MTRYIMPSSSNEMILDFVSCKAVPFMTYFTVNDLN